MLSPTHPSSALLLLSGFAALTHAIALTSFEGVYGSNFNETLTFCYFKPNNFELNTWHMIPVLGQAADSGQSAYNIKGALLEGGVYIAPNNSLIWKGLGFSNNGPYDTAFALAKEGGNTTGYYKFLPRANASTPAGETGPWLLYFRRKPTKQECAGVLRCNGKQQT